MFFISEWITSVSETGMCIRKTSDLRFSSFIGLVVFKSILPRKDRSSEFSKSRSFFRALNSEFVSYSFLCRAFKSTQSSGLKIDLSLHSTVGLIACASPHTAGVEFVQTEFAQWNESLGKSCSHKIWHVSRTRVTPSDYGWTEIKYSSFDLPAG